MYLKLENKFKSEKMNQSPGFLIEDWEFSDTLVLDKLVH